MSFSIFGKTKKAIFGNMLGLLVLGIFALSKTDLIKLDVEHIHKEAVSISEFNMKSAGEVISALKNFQPNMDTVGTEANKLGISIEDFQKSVTMNIVVSQDTPSPQEITIEFDSNIKNKDLTPIYKSIASDMKVFLANK